MIEIIVNRSNMKKDIETLNESSYKEKNKWFGKETLHTNVERKYRIK